MQYIFGAQQELDRFVDREMCFRIVDEHIILTVRIIRIDAERVVVRDALGINLAQLAVLARVAVRPVPLLADGLNDMRFFGHVYEIGPDKEPGVSIAATPIAVRTVSQFSSLVFRLVGRSRFLSCSET